MTAYRYRGLTTKVLYSFNTPLINNAGQPVVGGQHSVATYNSETVVYANNDGSVARGTATGAPPGTTDPYHAYTMPSSWESDGEIG